MRQIVTVESCKRLKIHLYIYIIQKKSLCFSCAAERLKLYRGPDCIFLRLNASLFLQLGLSEQLSRSLLQDFCL